MRVIYSLLHYGLLLLLIIRHVHTYIFTINYKFICSYSGGFRGVARGCSPPPPLLPTISGNTND